MKRPMGLRTFQDLIQHGYVKRAAEYFAALGQISYTRAADGHFNVTMRHAGTDKTPSLREAFHASNSAAKPMPVKLDQEFAAAGFTGFRPLAQGEDADVLRASHANGHDYAIRIAPARGNDRRIVSPFVVQAFAVHACEGYVVETMPAIQILTPEDPEEGSVVPAEQKKIILPQGIGYVAERAMLHLMPFALNHGGNILKDIGILPDGTLIQPDPGQIRYADPGMYDGKPALLRQALANLLQKNRDMDIPEAFCWFTADGAWKQDRFFHNPFASIPQYRGFTPLL